MNNEKKNNDGKVLYISGYGEDSNESVVYALNMPVSVTVHLENNGSGIVEFREKTEKDNWKLICQTGFIPDATPPVRMSDFEKDYNLEENIAKTVAEWISVYMRTGMFCTDSKKLTFLSCFDLRDIAARLEKNMEDVYNKYRDIYS